MEGFNQASTSQKPEKAELNVAKHISSPEEMLAEHKRRILSQENIQTDPETYSCISDSIRNIEGAIGAFEEKGKVLQERVDRLENEKSAAQEAQRKANIPIDSAQSGNNNSSQRSTEGGGSV